VERLWRSVKYEEVYLKAYESLSEARKGLGDYFEFYNQMRRHQGLDYRSIVMSSTPLKDQKNLFNEPRPPLGFSC
jgi:putative transposase